MSTGADNGLTAPEDPDLGETGVATAKRGGRNIPVAIAVAVVLIAAVAASLFIWVEIFVGLAILACAFALWELRRGFIAAGIKIAYLPLVVGSAGMLISAFTAGVEAAFVAFILTAGVAVLWHIFDDTGERAIPDILASVFAAVYIPFMASFVVHMAAAPQDGHWRVVTFVLVVIASDTGAFFAGVTLGRHKMAPVVSPNKSWEGLAGGVALAAAVGILATIYLLDSAWWIGLVIGIAGAVTAVLGDLTESLIKRDLGVKDMGNLLPGHGGVLDRVDSILVAAPAVFAAMVFLIPK